MAPTHTVFRLLTIAQFKKINVLFKFVRLSFTIILTYCTAQSAILNPKWRPILWSQHMHKLYFDRRLLVNRRHPCSMDSTRDEEKGPNGCHARFRFLRSCTGSQRSHGEVPEFLSDFAHFWICCTSRCTEQCFYESSRSDPSHGLQRSPKYDVRTGNTPIADIW